MNRNLPDLSLRSQLISILIIVHVLSFCKICSGKFSRNTPYYHVRHDKTMRFSSPTQFMAQRKTTVDEAWAGDIIGLPDNGTFKIGDTLTEGEKLHFRGIPSFFARDV